MAVQRSPKYPSLGLDAAVQAVKKIYDKERRAAVPQEVIGKALGYDSPSGKLSGPALSKIGSLRQFGLLEKVQGKLKISDLALDFVVHSPNDSAYQSAARKAFQNPPLFAELLRECKGASDDALRAHLVKAGFSEEATAKIIRAFRDSIAFAKLDGEDYNDDEVEIEQEDVSDDEPEKKRPPERDRRNQPQQGGDGVAYSWPLGGGNKVELGFASEPTRAQLDVMLAQLQIMRDVAPSESDKSQPERDEG